MIPFWKLQGIGNDFVFLASQVVVDEAIVRKLCDRQDGIGADGLITVTVDGAGQAVMRMWNPDGSESKMCGNGLRCAAHWLDRFDHARPDRKIMLGGSVYRVQRAGSLYSVEMGQASVHPNDIGLEAQTPWIDQPITIDNKTLSGTAVSIGNPHLVFFVEADLKPWLRLGPALEHHASFRERTNVHFARVLGPNMMEMVTWERGAGVTLACGSGACAVAEAAYRTGRIKSDSLIHLPGGDLTIRRENDQLTMVGPAAFVFEGWWSEDSLLTA